MTRQAWIALVFLAAALTASGPAQTEVSPVIVVETMKGTFEFETFADEAPKTVSHLVDLVNRGFYDGQRFHRTLPGFVIQWGDPRSRDLGKQAEWGRGATASSGNPIGVSEINKKRTHSKGTVAMAHAGATRAGG